MAKRRGNPNWGKPEPIGPIVPTITEFEQVVREYKLTPDQYPVSYTHLHAALGVFILAIPQNLLTAQRESWVSSNRTDPQN